MVGVGGTLGNYRVLSELGRGGMGAVFMAEHTLIGKRAAAKILLPQYSHDPAIVERFFNEAKAATQIRHPGIVEVFDFGYAEDGSAYLVMELLDGQSLSARLKASGGRLPEPLLLELTRQLAATLRAAHEQKIIHRDLKPDNAFLVADADLPFGTRVKLLDFGIAKLMGDGERANRTRTGMVMGTPAYMSPEQCRSSGGVDARSDVYSLGCMMFEMAAGRVPFVGQGPGDIIGAHIFSEVPSVLALVPSLSPGLAALITSTLQKTPDARPQSMADVLARLEALGIRKSGPLAVTRPPSGKHDARTISLTPSTTLSSAAAEVAPTAPGSARRWWLVPALLLVGAGAGGAWYRWRPTAPEPPPPPPHQATEVVSAVLPAPVPKAAPAVVPAAVPTKEGVRINVTIESVPVGADVFSASDGVRIGKTPLTESLTARAGQAGYILRLHGFRDQRINVPIDHDSNNRVTLTKASSSGHATGEKPPAKPDAVKSTDPTKPVKPVSNAVIDPFAN